MSVVLALVTTAVAYLAIFNPEFAAVIGLYLLAYGTLCWLMDHGS